MPAATTPLQSVKTKNFFTLKKFYVLLFIVLCGFLVLALEINYSLIRSREKAEEAIIEAVSKIEFPEEGEKFRTKELLKEGFSQKKAESIEGAFLILSFNYSSRPNAEKRDLLQKIASYEEKYFPKNEITLSFICKDEGCGAKKTEPLFGEIRKVVSSDQKLSGEFKSSVNNQLANLEFYEDVVATNEMIAVFDSLKTAYIQTSDEKYKDFAIKVSELIKQNNSQVYEQLNKAKFFEIK